ncbi:uncharacterized protein DFL_008950 [Arthrobotrys flagrans]|uniref:Glutaredoxin-like protein n=1 Tax=Arthrobotrys flagrans TaxID=97331 RepID=A0A436ZQF1_ARTFL|nr:hypothetical protein DFL_008950 [Arthrobotrys flagrans]
MAPRIPWNLLRLTFFTKKDCSLCQTAAINAVGWRLSETGNKAQYKTIDIFEPGNEKWHDAYVFDVPVLHIENENEPSKILKLMHRFTGEEIGAKVQELGFGYPPLKTFKEAKEETRPREGEDRDYITIDTVSDNWRESKTPAPSRKGEVKDHKKGPNKNKKAGPEK